MEFEFKVRVSVERDEGLFASRADLGEQLEDALEEANPDSLEGENGGQYSVVEWEVSNDSDR